MGSEKKLRKDKKDNTYQILKYAFSKLYPNGGMK
jgi:hypothetical protein